VRPGWSWTEGEYTEISQYLRWVAEKAGQADLEDYPSALLYLAVNENEEHRKEVSA
jgi:hypothetical protein